MNHFADGANDAVMSDAFAFTGWLDFAELERAPGYYALLGLECFEADRERIARALLNQTGEISAHLQGRHRKLAKAALAELRQAEACLTDAVAKAAYDARLRESLQQGGGISPPRGISPPHRAAEPVTQTLSALEPTPAAGKRSTFVFRRLPTVDIAPSSAPQADAPAVAVNDESPAAEAQIGPPARRVAEPDNVETVLLVATVDDVDTGAAAVSQPGLPQGEPPLLLEVAGASIPVTDLCPGGSTSNDTSEPVVLLEVFEIRTKEASPGLSPEVEAGAANDSEPAERLKPNESAAAIAERILRDDVKPRHVPRKASDEVERRKLAAETDKKRPPADPEDKQPPGDVDRKRTTPGPRPKSPTGRVEPPPAIVPRLKEMPKTPLLSPTDLAETMRQQAARQQSPASRWLLAQVDVSLLLDRLASRLIKHRQRVAAGVLVLLGAWFALGYAEQVVRPPRIRSAGEEASSEDRRLVAHQLRLLHDERESPEARAAAVAELRAVAPAAIREFASALEAVVDKQSEPTIQQDLRTILQAALEAD